MPAPRNFSTYQAESCPYTITDSDLAYSLETKNHTRLYNRLMNERLVLSEKQIRLILNSKIHNLVCAMALRQSLTQAHIDLIFSQPNITAKAALLKREDISIESFVHHIGINDSDFGPLINFLLDRMEYVPEPEVIDSCIELYGGISTVYRLLDRQDIYFSETQLASIMRQYDTEGDIVRLVRARQATSLAESLAVEQKIVPPSPSKIKI